MKFRKKQIKSRQAELLFAARHQCSGAPVPSRASTWSGAGREAGALPKDHVVPAEGSTSVCLVQAGRCIPHCCACVILEFSLLLSMVFINHSYMLRRAFLCASVC